MYLPPKFENTDKKQIFSFMQAHPFALLAGVDDAGLPVATQAPIFTEGNAQEFTLYGHISKHTDHYAAFEKNRNVLVVFSHPGSYISASWYPNAQVASTWNYIAVQVHGELQITGKQKLREILEKTTMHFEKNKQSAALVSNMSEDYLDASLNEIAGFSIVVKEVKALFKLSQNKSDVVQQTIREHLEKGDAEAQFIAAQMKAQKKCPI